MSAQAPNQKEVVPMTTPILNQSLTVLIHGES